MRMGIFIVALMAVFATLSDVLATPENISSQVRAECESRDSLKLHAGHYARKAFWENLPKVKNWSEAMTKFNEYATSAIEISVNGEVLLIDGWHEAAENACVHFRNRELWAKKPYDSSSEWVGSFIHVGAAKSDSAVYFERVFGDNCYVSNNNEHWCFKSNSILIDAKRRKANLVLDTSEMPTYGTPVAIDAEKGFWIFVPTNDGWKIFQDTYVTSEEHEEINPSKSVPWRILKNLAN